MLNIKWNTTMQVMGGTSFHALVGGGWQGEYIYRANLVIGGCLCAMWHVKAWWWLVWAYNSRILKGARITIISIASSPPIASKH